MKCTKKAIRESILYKENWRKAKAVHGIKASVFLEELYSALNAPDADVSFNWESEELIGAMAWPDTPQGHDWWSQIYFAQVHTPPSTPKQAKKRELQVLL